MRSLPQCTRRTRVAINSNHKGPRRSPWALLACHTRQAAPAGAGRGEGWRAGSQLRGRSAGPGAPPSCDANEMSPRTINVRGVLAGRLWWPVGEPAYASVSGEIVRSDADSFPSGGPYPDLRTALLELSNDGNLASTGFLPGTLVLEVTRGPKAGGPPRCRTWTVRGTCWTTDDLFADQALVDELA